MSKEEDLKELKREVRKEINRKPTDQEVDVTACGILCLSYIIILLCLTIAAFVAQGAVFGFLVLAACLIPPMWMSTSYLKARFEEQEK